jgi:hypothetical protein
MRKLAITAIAALSLVLLSAAPALATGEGGNQNQDLHGTLNVWCTPDKDTAVDINGALTVPNGTNGSVSLMLFGSNGSGWSSTSESLVVHLVKGQTSYGFQFGAKLDSNHFTSYKVLLGGTSSRVINRDECGFRVPEAPSSALLMIGALPVVGLVGMRVAGIRMPLPHWTRIA